MRKKLNYEKLLSYHYVADDDKNSKEKGHSIDPLHLKAFHLFFFGQENINFLVSLNFN